MPDFMIDAVEVEIVEEEVQEASVTKFDVEVRFVGDGLICGYAVNARLITPYVCEHGDLFIVRDVFGDLLYFNKHAVQSIRIIEQSS